MRMATIVPTYFLKSIEFISVSRPIRIFIATELSAGHSSTTPAHLEKVLIGPWKHSEGTPEVRKLGAGLADLCHVLCTVSVSVGTYIYS
jgi:hypothetical protein